MRNYWGFSLNHVFLTMVSKVAIMAASMTNKAVSLFFFFFFGSWWCHHQS